MARIVGKVDGVALGTAGSAVTGAGGIEEEWFLEGDATRYTLAGGATEYPHDGRWDVEPTGTAPFRTRMLVTRPVDPAAFNGTVVVDWNNVSAGEGARPGRAVARMLEDGFAVAAVSAQAAGVVGRPAEALAPGQVWPSLKTNDPDRYGSLEHPGDDYCYDIYTQAARLVAPDRPARWTRWVAWRCATSSRGGSQSGARLGGYVNGIQATASVLDAFLIIVFPNAPTAMNAASAPDELRQTGGPNVFDLLPWYTYLLRDDLEAPILILNSEAEASECHPNVQPDTDRVRVWEVAGTGHGGLMSAEDRDALEASGALAGSTGNRVSFAPAGRAALHALRSWLDGGPPPQLQPRLLKDDATGRLPRDEHGNAIGGIRWPDLEAPLGTHMAEHFDDSLNMLQGSSVAFPPEKVAELYDDQAAWLAKYNAAVDHLVETGVVLPDDAAAMRTRAGVPSLPGLSTRQADPHPEDRCLKISPWSCRAHSTARSRCSRPTSTSTRSGTSRRSTSAPASPPATTASRPRTAGGPPHPRRPHPSRPASWCTAPRRQLRSTARSSWSG